MGWSSVQAAELSGVPKRTVQQWRKDSYFVPWLDVEEWTGHPQGELFSLADVVTLRVMRTLLEAGVDREIVARVGEELPASEVEGEEFMLPVRWLATRHPRLGSCCR